jgi:hypothetical protein
MQRIYLALMLLAVLSSSVGGSPLTALTHFPGVQIQSQTVDLAGTPSSQAVSIWSVASDKRLLAMQWTCTPFVSHEAPGESYDASLWLSPAVSGHRQIRVLKPFGRTDVSSNLREASVLAKSAHPGVTRMKLVVGLSGQFVAAGKYSTTVNLSVTAL